MDAEPRAAEPPSPRHSTPGAAAEPAPATLASPSTPPHRTRSRSSIKGQPEDEPAPAAAAAAAVASPLPPAPASVQAAHERAEVVEQQREMEVDDEYDQAPPTPAATSPSHSALPSFLSEDPLSDDPNTSSDDDSDGNAKPARAPRFDSHGLRRPTPSYYYDAEYDPANVGAKKRRRRGGMKGIPVFEPTMEEFEGEGGFYGYVKRIEKYGMRSGVVKVVPPKAWTDALPSTSGPLRSIRMREPIEQHMVGSQGLYRVTNVAKSRIWNPAQWKEMAETPKWAAPDFLEQKPDRTDRSTKGVSTRKPNAEPRVRKPPAPVVEGERKKKGKRGRKKGPVAGAKGKGKAVETVAEEGEAEAEAADAGDDEMDVEHAEPVDSAATVDHPNDDVAMLPSPAATEHLPSHLPTPPTHPDSPSLPAASPPPTLPLPSDPTPAPPVPTTTPTPKKKRPSNMARAEPTEAEWQAFINTFESLPHGMKATDYTIELLREVERRYWRTLTFGEPPMYGADMKGSLFDDSTTAWNVAHLGDLLPKLAPASCRIPGVVSPYLYFGMWRATFAWHVEDADLYSINYIHFGAPKFWYSVPQEQSDRFERIMEGFFPTDRTKCSQFLRHKSFLASPRVLANSGITLNRVVQLPGEFILTYPKGYHSGFNLGFNAAESINFATERWLPLGKVAKSCYCIGDSVNIDVDIWLREAALAESVIKNEALALLAPLHSSVSFSGRKRNPPSYRIEHDDPSPLPALKRVKLEQPLLLPSPPPPPAPKPREMTKKAKIEQEKAAKEDSWMCALCPEMSTEGLVRVGEPGVRTKKVLNAHRVCVMFTPATWIEIDPSTNEEIVRGYAGIEKARWKLKCQLCSEKHGTKIQCTRGKCPKAYHVTCALQEDSGVFLDATTAEDGEAFSLLGQAIKELDQAKESGSPTLASRVAIPHRVAPAPVAVATPAPAAAIEAGPSSSVAVAGSSTDPALPPVAGPSGAVVAAPPAEPVVDDDGGIKLTVLCRLHNPVYQKIESERKAAELKKRVDEIVVQSRIRVRTSGGVFEVTYTACLDYKEAVSVVFDDGKRSDIKWKNIIWPDTPEVARRKEAAASRAHDDNAYVWENRPIAPTKRGTFQPPLVPNGPFTPTAQPYQPTPLSLSNNNNNNNSNLNIIRYGGHYHPQNSQHPQYPPQHAYSPPPSPQNWPPHYAGAYPPPGYGWGPGQSDPRIAQQQQQQRGYPPPQPHYGGYPSYPAAQARPNSSHSSTAPEPAHRIPSPALSTASSSHGGSAPNPPPVDRSGSAGGYQGRPFPPMATAPSQQHQQWQPSNSRGEVVARPPMASAAPVGS
ncbi:hypothetical protein RQP46_009529 [Phenoliferia psychrophenolica]